VRASSGVRFTKGALNFSSTIAISTTMAHKNEASSLSLGKRTTPRCKSGTHMKRWNYYTVRRGYNSNLYLNWPDYEREEKGFSGPQFKGFQRREEAKNYLVA
jgi:hypothetical protein